MSRTLTVRDSRRVPIVEGAVVAYNRSGDVIEGEVIRVASRSRILVQAHPDFQQGRDGTKPSIVRNPRSILVL